MVSYSRAGNHSYVFLCIIKNNVDLQALATYSNGETVSTISRVYVVLTACSDIL